METNPTPTLHTLKLGRQFYEAKLKGLKPWELRNTLDRTFRVGDRVRFIEVEGGEPTGRETSTTSIQWVLEGGPTLLPEGLCIFTHEDIRRPEGAANEVLNAYLELRKVVEAPEPDPILEHYGTMRAEVGLTLLAMALGRPWPYDPWATPEELEAQGFDHAAATRKLNERIVAFLRMAAAGNTEPDALAAEAGAILEDLKPSEAAHG